MLAQSETLNLMQSASARLARNMSAGAVEDMKIAMRAGFDVVLAGTPDRAAQAMAAHGTAYLKSASARCQSAMLDAAEIQKSLFVPMSGVAKTGSSETGPQGV